MKKEKVVLWILAIICIFSFNAYSQNCGYDYGKNIGSYRGVIAYSNGSCTGYGYGDHQCTKYVSRFYKEYFHFEYYLGIGNASQFFSKAKNYNGFVAYENNSTSPPKQDMILCYGGGDYGYGHVAIITRVDLNARVLDIIDQNRHRSNPYVTNISITILDGRYSVSTKGLGSKYYVQGWVGLDSPNPTPTPNPPVLGTSRTILNFGSSSTRQAFSIRNVGYGTLTWNISDNKDWIDVSPTSGAGNRIITVYVNRSNLLYGSNAGYLYISSNGGNRAIKIYATNNQEPISPQPGYFADGWREGISNKFVGAYNYHGGEAIVGKPIDRGGSAYVHIGLGGYYAQDFQRTDGRYWMLQYNPQKDYVYAAHDAILHYLITHNCFNLFGAMTSHEISGKYVGSNYFQNGSNIVVQILLKGTDLINRKTIVWNSQKGTGHYPVGRLNLNGSPGDNWYIYVNGGSQDKYIFTIGPNETAEGWLDAGTYTFIKKRDGQIVMGSGVTHTVYEGNNQIIDITPKNPLLSVSTSSLDFGSSATTRNFIVKNSGNGTLSGTISDNRNWIFVSSASFSLTQGQSRTITTTINRSNLSTGSHTGVVAVNSNNGNANINIYAVKDSPPPDPTPTPPPPDPDPDPLPPDPDPAPTTNTVKFTSSNRILKLTGEFFNDYTTLKIAGGNLVIITKTISNGFEMKVPDNYTKINFLKGNSWYWPGRDGYRLVVDGVKWVEVENEGGWYYLDVGQDPDPLPPPPDPDPDPTPTPTTNTVKFTSSNRILKLTGEFFNDYTTLKIAGGNLVIITKTISNGFEMKVSDGYVKINFLKGNNWYWPGRDGYRLVVDGVKWVEVENEGGWYYLNTGLPKIANLDSMKLEKINDSKNYCLSQNYPNPFNPETVINFSTPNQEFVILKIYNMLGVEIAILVNGLVEKGEHKIIFCDNQLPAGIYFYQIKAGKFIDTKKMIFAK